MKIVKVETAWIAMPMSPPQGLSIMDMKESTDAVVRITTDEGLRGIGEARGAPLTEICKIIAEEYTPLLLGEDPRATQFLWDKMYNHKLAHMSPPWAPMRPYQAAQAAVDLALWDIKAKAANQSVCELIGGKPHPVPAYLAKGFYVKDQSLDEMCAEFVEELELGGYKHLKMRGGRYGKDETVQRVKAMREAVGPDIKIALDINCGFDSETTIAVAKEIEQYDIMWIEEPIGRAPQGVDKARPDYDHDLVLGEIASQTSIPLSSGENHFTLRDCESLITKGGIKFMQFDMVKNGGLTEYLKISALCEARGIFMAPHHVPHFHLMPVAAQSHAIIVECYDNKRQNPSWPYLFDGYPEVKDGYMQFPEGHGWGMEINDAFLKKHGTPVSWDF